MNKTSTDGWWRKIVASVPKINNPFNGLLTIEPPDDVIIIMATRKDAVTGLEKPEYYLKTTPNRMYTILEGGDVYKIIGDIPGHYINDPSHKMYDGNRDDWDIIPIPPKKKKEYAKERLSFISNTKIRKTCERLGLHYMGGKPGIFQLMERKMSWIDIKAGEIKRKEDETTNHIRYKHTYFTKAKAKTGGIGFDTDGDKKNENLPLEFDLLYTLEIINPFKFNFNAENTLEIIEGKIESCVLEIVSKKDFDWVNTTNHETDSDGLSKEIEKMMKYEVDSENNTELAKTLHHLGVKIIDITYRGWRFSGPRAEELEALYSLTRNKAIEEAEAETESIKKKNEAMFGTDPEVAKKGFFTNLKDSGVLEEYFETERTKAMADAIKHTKANFIPFGGFGEAFKTNTKTKKGEK